MYNITVKPSVRKVIERLSEKDYKRIFERIKSLEGVPFPKGCKKVQGGKDLFRIRQGKYRIIYTVNSRDKIIDIIRIAHRREVYRL